MASDGDRRRPFRLSGVMFARGLDAASAIQTYSQAMKKVRQRFTGD